MFGNPSVDYGGNPMGPCQCDQCKARFEKRFGRTLPTTLDDPDYRAFMRDSSSEVAGMFAELIHRLRPGAGFFTYIDEHTDGIMSESNTAVGRALPLWPYSASDNVNRALNSEPEKMSFNLCMSFVDYSWRFVTVPQAEIRLRLHQNLGTAPRRRWSCWVRWTRRIANRSSPENPSSSGTRSTRSCTSASAARPACCC